MKKILFLIQLPPPVHGVSQINEQVFNSKIFYQNFHKSLVQLKFSDNLKDLRKFNLKKVIRFCKVFFQLVYKILKDRPDLIYFSIMPIGPGFIRDLVYVFIIKLFRVKLIYHLHRRGIEKRINNPFIRKIYRWTFSKSITIHLSDNLLKKEIISLKLKNSKYFVLPNGIPDISIEEKIEIKKGLNILFLSNILEEKGVFILLKAFTILTKEFDNIYLDIAGESFNEKSDKSIVKFIEDNNLSERIEFHSGKYGDEKWKLYKKADIFVFPTYLEECFPLVILEAMRFGLPVISTSEGAIPEIVDDNKTGFLVKKQDINSLIYCMRVLVNSKKLRSKFGDNGRKKFLKNYADKIFKKNIRNIFTNIELILLLIINSDFWLSL